MGSWFTEHPWIARIIAGTFVFWLTWICWQEGCR